jgi:N-acetylmuramoyl-L-alanine amidase
MAGTGWTGCSRKSASEAYDHRDPGSLPPVIAVDTVPLAYAHRLAHRDPAIIDLVVIHCTELPDLQTAREFGERIRHHPGRTGNCGHFYIDRDGRIESWVDIDRVAHHVRGYNDRSIGIELVNNGRWPDWLHSGNQEMSDPYPAVQINALAALLRKLQERLPALQWIAGHEHLDRERVPASDAPGIEVFRKRDPGPMFPWQQILASCPLQRLGE